MTKNQFTVAVLISHIMASLTLTDAQVKAVLDKFDQADVMALIGTQVLVATEIMERAEAGEDVEAQTAQVAADMLAELLRRFRLEEQKNG